MFVCLPEAKLAKQKVFLFFKSVLVAPFQIFSLISVLKWPHKGKEKWFKYTIEINKHITVLFKT
jgi:hypothetical protein